MLRVMRRVEWEKVTFPKELETEDGLLSWLKRKQIARVVKIQEFGFTDPEPWEAFTEQRLPREGDQVIEGPDAENAYRILMVEWRLDLEEIHLFCRHFPKDVHPVSDRRRIR